MRLLLAAAVFLHSAQAADVGMNQPCNKELDGLLATDPSGNPNTFLSCVGVGVGNIGFWERKVCPNDMVFDFINQQCKAKRKKSRKQQTLNIAILNNSCAQGETCIGGTVCDLDTLRCLCPFGTIPQVETLSCIKNDVSPAFNFNSFNFESGFNTGDFFRPNPKAATAYPSYSNRGNQEQGYSGSSSSWQPFPSGTPSEFKPNHNQFNFNVFTTAAPPPTTQKVPILAYPGQSCRNDEVCSGGSICTLPIGLCLCPGELEARDGECVLPAAAAGIQITKVGIGALCSELAECDHGSSCIMGRCACVAPLVQHEGKCVLRQESKKVGPGELCDNGEVCIKGSVCDSVIPVCVCPTDTDLRDGECIRVAPKTAAPRPATYIPAMTAPPPTARPQPPQPLPTQAPFTHPAPTYVPPTQPIQTYRPATPPPALAPSTVNYQSFSPPPMRPTIKPNHMKINLGGSKQAGVGVRCALNTDCMIGAYCNGNTNPPSCQCLSTHVNIEGRCEKIVYPGQIGCRSDLQCSSAYTGTTCIDRVCVCPEGNKAVDQTCVPANEPVTSPPGGSCTEARECTGGSVCREGWCICPDPTMIVQKGICIQSGPRPTLPSRTVPVYTTPSPAYTPAAAPVYHTAANPTAGRTFNALPNPQQQSRKRTPGSQCGPLDTCVGGSTCVESLCVCPAGMQPSMNGRCELAPSTSPSVVAASQYSRPGESCSLGQVCTGGSTCPADTQLCTCPPEKPLIIKEYCHPETPARRQAVAGESCDANTDCTNGSACHSGQCRCPPQYVAFSGHCVHMPMQTTPAMKMVAKPLESCDDGEVCTGGSSCDEDTGMCMCPPGQVAFGEQCRHPPTVAPRTATQAPTRPSPVIITTPAPRAECSNDAHCTPGKTCIAGKCRCRPGTMDNGGICEPIEARKPLKYGQPCDHLRDRCTNGAKCLDNVCKCTPGFVLSPAGWCERFHFQLTTTLKPKTFNALPAAPEKIVESVLPARPAWNVPIEPATARPQTPASINFHATLATSPPYTAPPRPPIMVTFPPTVATVPPIRETYPPPTPRTYAPPQPMAPVPTQPPVQVLPADNSGPRIRGRVAGTSCKDTDICLHGSSCIHGRCQCRPPLVARNGHCVKLHLAAPGEPCSKGEQCTGGSICDNDQEMCVCASRHTIVDGVCKSKDAALFVPPGSQCGGAQVCSGGSYCASGTCLCDSNHYAEDGYCRHITSQSSEIDHETGGPLRFSAMLSPRAPATVCDPEKCRLPDCFCSVTGRIPPLSDPIVDVPQFVVLTFDDAVNGRTLPDYLTLFADQRYRNPNGCPVKGTFFVSHEWTNYDAVQWLADQDMEVASNSISHTNMAGENASRWLNEMDGQRRILAKFGNIPEEKIVGMRAPQLSAGGDAQFEMMSRAGFLYDNTLSANPGIHGEPYWPQTLDYAVPWNCYEENCPTSSFPGLWEVPLNQFYGAYVRQIDSYRRSSMIRAAVDLNNTIEELTNMLLTNFDRAYTSNKAPFVLSLNADFLQLNGRNEGMAALQKFLDEIMQHKDVFLVSLHQLIEWMQNPLPMTMIHKSDPLRCDRARFSSNPRNACTQPNKCMYRTPAMSSYEHQFKTCAPCPDVFPWIHNPTGNIR